MKETQLAVIDSKENKFGLKGVSYHKTKKKFLSRITVGNKRKFLGYFTTSFDAGLAYRMAAKEYFGESLKKDITGVLSSNWKGGRVKKSEGYIEVWSLGHPRANNRMYVYEHVLIAEKALGRIFNSPVCVHHIDGKRSNNIPGNLIICEDNAYHHLLHVRKRALLACGNANYRKCGYCGKYDDVINMVIPNHWRHAECSRIYSRNRNKERSGKAVSWVSNKIMEQGKAGG